MRCEHSVNSPDSVEELFDTEVGDAFSVHILPNGARIPYVTLGFIGAAESAKTALERLHQEFKRIRGSLPESPKPKLFWRHPARIDISQGEHGRWTVRSRVAIPGVDWSHFTPKPEGLPYPEA